MKTDRAKKSRERKRAVGALQPLAYAPALAYARGSYRIAIAFVFVLVLGVVSAPAQDKGKEPEKKPDATAKPAKPKETPKSPPIAIVGADVYTVTRGVLRNATVLVKDGKIVAVGQDVAIPAGATKIDAAGKFVTPGFITLNATNVGLRMAGGGGQAGAQPKFADSLNPYDRNMLYCLGSGITTACIEVGSGFGRNFGRAPDDTADTPNDGTSVCPCCGLTIMPTEPITPPVPTERTPRRTAVLKLTYGDMAPMLAKESPFYSMPAGSFAGALNRVRWRETIAKAKKYVKDQADHEADEDKTGGPPRRTVPEEVVKLVKKELALRTDGTSVEQIRDMVALAKELDYNLILDDVYEGWLIPSELASAKVSAVITPRSRRRPTPGKEDTSGSSIELSGTLEKAGVPFAVTPLGASVSLDGIPGRDLTSLALEAAYAVRGGATEQAALAALTIAPARMLGMADRIGSIEAGKDADLLILDGPPLDYRSYVETALVGGKVYYERDKVKVFPERRPNK